MRALLIGASVALVSSCASKERISTQFPPAEDLQVKPKPALDPAALDSEAALDRHDDDVKAWGEEGWLQIGRLCRWATGNGAILPFACPARPVDEKGD
jgi:hypothetical protein